MVDGRPPGYGEVPTAAARLVIVLLPVGNEQPADSIPGDASVTAAWPPRGIPPVRARPPLTRSSPPAIRQRCLP